MAGELISTQEAAKRLRVKRSQLQNLFPYLPHIYIAKRQTRLFVGPYIDAYAETLQGRGATLRTVVDFARTERAQQLIRDAQTRINEALSNQASFNAKEVMALFCIGRMTVTQWGEAGVFSVVRRSVPPKRDRGQRRSETLLILSTELRQAFTWRVPQV